MYEELNNLLSEKTQIDLWYDDGFIIAQDILSDFSDTDWKKLSNEVLDKDLSWQKKLVYCLDNKIIKEELEIVVKLLSCKNDELLEMCIDTLRSFDNELGHSYIKSHPEIISNISKEVDSVDIVTKEIFKSFLEKFSI